METLAQFFGINKKILVVLSALLIAFVVLGYFNFALSIGIVFIFFLTTILFVVLFYLGVRDKNVYVSALIVFAIHLIFASVLYVLNYHTSIRIFGGGADFDLYQNNAIEFANRLRHGIFSFKGLYVKHYFSIVVGLIYFITVPDPIIGQMLTVFTATFSAVLLYLIVIEIGGSKKWAFLSVIFSTFYLSYAVFGSVLLKEIFVIPLILLSLLILIKILKKFSIVYFICLFVTIVAIIHFRFYIGFAVMFTFVICYFFISKMSFRNKVVLSLMIGLTPALMSHGYFGWIPISNYLIPEQIRVLREVTYAPVSSENAQKLIDEKRKADQQEDSGSNFSEGFDEDLATTIDFFKERNKANAEFKTLEGRQLTAEEIAKGSGTSSSFSVQSETDNPFMFIVNYAVSFIYTFFGPFPWQVKATRQVVAFFEVIPWWFFFISILYGAYAYIKNEGIKKFWGKYVYAMPLCIFGIMTIGAISLFINNYGIIMRIRIPVIISFLAIFSLNPLLFENIFSRLLTLLKIKRENP